MYRFTYYIFPVFCFLAFVVWENYLPYEYRMWVHGEDGAMEYFQAILLALAFLVGLVFTLRMALQLEGFLTFWGLLATVCCFYVLGEEMSWGQHLLGWETNEFWGAINDQNETNLHNTSSWLDQKPRLILEIGIVFGGIIWHLFKPYVRAFVPEVLQDVMPPVYLWVTALMAEIAIMTERGTELLHGKGHGFYLFTRASEVQEFFFYLFVLFYLVHLYRTRIIKG